MDTADKNLVKLVCNRCKKGNPLSSTAEVCMVSVEELYSILARKVNISERVIKIIFNMHKRGESIDQISEDLEIDKQTLLEFLPSSSANTNKSNDETRNEETKQTLETLIGRNSRAKATRMPEFIYSYQFNSTNLYRTNLATGATACFVISHSFFIGSVWCEIPGENLYITGGRSEDYTYQKKAVAISPGTFDVSSRSDMITQRGYHSAVAYRSDLIVLGGNSKRNLRECEKFISGNNKWVSISPLPQACFDLNAIVLEDTRSLYALGGKVDEETPLRTIQHLNLDSLDWSVHSLQLPDAACWIPIFKLDESQGYFIVNQIIYGFNSSSINIVGRIVEGETPISKRGASHFCGGYLYCSSTDSPPKRVKIN